MVHPPTLLSANLGIGLPANAPVPASALAPATAAWARREYASIGFGLALLLTLEAVERTPADRARLLHFVIVGGGPTGVEFAAELEDYLRSQLVCEEGGANAARGPAGTRRRRRKGRRRRWRGRRRRG